MRALFLGLAIAMLAGCAATVAEQAAPPPSPAPPPPPPPAPAVVGGTIGTGAAATAPICMLSIQFGSYAMGIDGATRARVETILVGDRAVTGFDTRRWGHEGEVTFCVRTRAAADARRLFQAVRPMIPARPRGPIEMRTSDGLRYLAPRR